jgi:hypothetical protein
MLQSARADCDRLGHQNEEADSRLGLAMEHYKAAVAKLARSDDRSRDFSEAVSANGDLLQALGSSIVVLEQGKAEGCFGREQDSWNEILENLKRKRDEFGKERDGLLKSAMTVREDGKNKSTGGKTSVEFLNEKLDTQFKAINDKAPLEIDSNTLLTNVQRTGTIVTYSYKVNISKSSWKPSTEKALVQSTIKNVCGNESVRPLLSMGYEYRYVSVDSAGLLLVNVLVTAKKCKGLGDQEVPR